MGETWRQTLPDMSGYHLNVWWNQIERTDMAYFGLKLYEWIFTQADIIGTIVILLKASASS